jgi:hypothetical protein
MQISIPSEAVTTQVRVRVFKVGNGGSKLIHFRAERGKGYTPSGVQGVLDGIVEMLDKQFPADEFDIVRVGAFAYNVVWRSARPAPASQVGV